MRGTDLSQRNPFFCKSRRHTLLHSGHTFSLKVSHDFVHTTLGLLDYRCKCAKSPRSSKNSEGSSKVPVYSYRQGFCEKGQQHPSLRICNGWLNVPEKNCCQRKLTLTAKYIPPPRKTRSVYYKPGYWLYWRHDLRDWLPVVNREVIGGLGPFRTTFLIIFEMLTLYRREPI